MREWRRGCRQSGIGEYYVSKHKRVSNVDTAGLSQSIRGQGPPHITLAKVAWMGSHSFIPARDRRQYICIKIFPYCNNMSDQSRQKATVYVGGLDNQVNQQVLHDAFIPFGEIVDVSLPKPEL